MLDRRNEAWYPETRERVVRVSDAPPLYVSLVYVVKGVEDNAVLVDLYCEVVNVHTSVLRIGNVNFSVEGWRWADGVDPVFGYELDVPGSGIQKFYVGAMKSVT